MANDIDDKNGDFGPHLSSGAAAGVSSVTATDASVTISGTGANPTVGLPLSAATPLAPGTAAAGTSTTKSNDDHRHAPLIRFCTYHFLANIPANATTALNMVLGDTNYPQAIFCRAATLTGLASVSYTHLTLPTNREV